MMSNKISATIAAMFAKRTSDLAKRFRGVAEDVIQGVKPVYCVDGASLSVQASRYHYCAPKNNEGPYSLFEVGFPSVKPPESWRDLCEGDFNTQACDTVYAYVPMALIVEFIELHGGLREEEAPKLVLPSPAAPVKRSFIEQRRYDITMEDLGVRV